MAITDPQDCLAYHLSRPLTTSRSLAKIPCSVIAGKVSAFMAADEKPDTVPEIEALEFYGLNHFMAEIQKSHSPCEPLGGFLPQVESYYATMNAKAIRAFYYLILICSRESRHNKSKTALKADPDTSDAALDCIHNYKSKGSGGVVDAFLKTPPNVPLGPYVNGLRQVFYKGSFNGGFGGKAWGAVADCLCRFVSGEFTGEVMLDTVWTLAHNNGPIFNKGMLYQHYTGDLLPILDIQRSGQIPELVLHPYSSMAKFISPQLHKDMLAMKKLFPDEVGDYVDWFKVKALGGVGHYPGQMSQQVQKHGPSPYAASIKDTATAAHLALIKAQEALQAKAAAQKAEHAKNNWEMMPGEWVPKVQLKRVA